MRAATLLVAALVVLSGCSFLGGGSGTATPADAPTPTATATPAPSPTATATPTATAGVTATATPTPTATVTPAPTDAGLADPETDRLGWEGGYWYNESLSITPEDGLNETELDAVVARSMARVEAIRGLEFNRTVPVAILSPAEYRADIESRFGDTTTAQRLHQNVKWEATFVLNESTDAVAVQRASFVNGTGGFYDPAADEIVIVSDDPSATRIREQVVGHELVHALQDQQFGTDYNRSTTDADHGISGIVEGDADYVEARYEDRCEDEWTCLTADPPAPDVNVGLQVATLVPYSEGGELVRDRYEAGGWAAVDAMYANPPATAEQIIHHEAYPDELPRTLAIDHSASDGWRVLRLDGSINHATFGEGALFSMFWYATFEATQDAGTIQNVVIPYRDLFNFEPGTTQLRDVGPYNYSHPVTEGWDGDRLVPYVTDASNETGETGYVWKLAWDSEDDAREFARAYRDLLEYRGAQPVDGRANTYAIPEGQEFADAFHVTRNGDVVVIVNAPTVDDLGDVHASAGPASDTGDGGGGGY